MSSGVYRNLGRGGAGNYYSKADLEEAAKRIPQVMIPREVTLWFSPDTLRSNNEGYPT